MGGTIATIIKLNDKIYKLDGITNSLPEFVKIDKFIECDKKWIKYYISCFNEVKTFSPEGYGLDIFDFDNKRILTMQGYCSYYTIDYTNILMYLNGCVGTDTKVNDRPPEASKRMYNKKYTKLGTYSDDYKRLILDEQPEKYEDALKILKKQNKKRFRTDFFNIMWDKLGWTYIEFNEGMDGSIKMLDYCIKNYKLSPTDIDDWFENFYQQLNDYDEEYNEEPEKTKDELNKLKHYYKTFYRTSKLKEILTNDTK